MSAYTIPKRGGGGPTLDQAEEKDLLYWLERKLKDLPSSRYPDKDREWIDAAKAELARRGVDAAQAGATSGGGTDERRASGGGPSGAPSTGQGRARKRLADAQSFSDAKQLLSLLDEIEQDYNIVGAVAIGDVPLGHSVVLTVVRIHPQEWHKQENGWGLAGSALSRIADAAGVSTTASVQTHYDPRGMCRFVVSVARQELSGGVRSETKSGTIDLRPGTKEHDAMLAEGKARRAKAIQEKWARIPDDDGQIRAKLKHLPALAETKGYLRSVRKLLAIDRSYTDVEKTKAFAVMKLSFTGRCPENPEVERMFARGLMQASLGGVATLYGRAGGMAAPQLAAPAQPIGLLHGGPARDGDFEEEDDVDDIPPARPTPRPSGDGTFDDMDQPYGDDAGEESY